MADGGTYRFSIEPQVRLDQASGQIAKLQQQLEKLSMPKSLGAELKKELGNLSDLMSKYKDQLKQGISSKADSKALDQTRKQVEQTYQGIINKIDELNDHDIILKADASALKDLEKQITSLKERIQKEFAEALSGDNTKLSSLSGATRSTQLKGMVGQAQTALENGNLKAYEKAIDSIRVKINDLAETSQKKLGKALTGTEFTNSEAALKAIGKELDQMKTNADKAYNAVKPLQDELSGKEITFGKELEDALERGEQATQGLNSGLNKTKQNLDSVDDSVVNAQNSFEKLEKTTRTLESQVESYFGLNAIFRTVANLAREAMETVKTLDKAMTETAVVTNYSVGDMWEKLPIYTAEANKLGSTIEDVYRATTLYYQQGLNTTQSMGLAVETLKMARIANMDAKDATDAMTAALRGFNLELNQVSAQRINDVYSELAAITASDTQEISKAMEKVASLAHNAGMELETTSAFLAQMIETTRETPENLGTALKTVVARFQEMKQDPTKLIDSEGVMLDANKVDKALKSIGVNLLNTNGEFRKLDDVFLEIAAKWDTLSMGQQRYIATMAAGSRQQSRFIAMMSNYSRTMELVDAAYDSSGASQRQFEKTLESMDSKLNRLKTAWDQFTMGLMNNELLKGAVDLGTDLLGIVNKLIDAVSQLAGPGKGIAKSIITLTATVAGLNGASKILHGVIQGGSQWAKGTNNKGLFTNIFGEVFKKKEKIKISDSDVDIIDDVNLQQQATKDAQTYSTTFLNTLKHSIGQTKQVLNEKQPLQVLPQNPVDAAYYKKLLKDAEQFEANGQIEMANAVRAQAGENIQKFTQNLTGTQKAALKTANAFNSAGMAIQAFGNALANSNSRLAPFGKALSVVGSGVMNLGTVMMPALTTAIAEGKTGMVAFGVAAKTAFTTILPWIAIIGAIAAVGYVLYQEFTRDKREMEALANAAKTSSDAFDNLKTSTETLKNSIEEIRNADSLFDGLVIGTTEWNLALVEANQQILDLIKKYPMLQEYMTTDANGRMSISEAGFEAVQEAQDQFLAQAQSLEILTNSAYNSKLKEQDYDKLLKENGVRKPIARQKGEEVITEQEAYNMGYSGLSDEAKKEWDGVKAQIEAEAANARKQAVRAALASNGELSDTVLSLFSQNLDTAAQSFKDETDMTVIKQAYADFIGGVFNSATGTITDLSGEEISVDNDALKKMYPQIMALLKFQDEAPQVESAVKSLGKSFDSLFGNKEGSTFINDLLNNNLEINLSQLEQFRNMEADEIVDILGDSGEELAKVILQNENASATELANQLKENAENLKDIQTESYKNVTVWWAKSIKKMNADTLKANVNIDTLSKFITSRLTVGSADAINNFMNQMSQSFDSAALSTIGESLFGALLGQPDDIQQELVGIVNNVDWSSAIERGRFYEEFAEDSEAFGKLNTEGQKFVKTTKQVDKGLNLTGKQFKELVQSSDFLEILTEKWSDFADDSGKIDASGVREMSKECGTLGKLLDLDEFKAENLAAALNYFQKTGSFDGINSATLAAMQHFDALGNLVGQVKEDLTNFDEGQNYMEGIDTYRSRMEELKKLYEGGQYSNDTTLKLARNLFGNKNFQDLVDTTGSNKAAEAKLMNAAPLLTENLQDTALMAVENIANGLDIFGEKVNEKFTDGLSVILNDDNIDFDFSSMTRQEDLWKAVANRLNISDELARGIVEAIAAQDWGETQGKSFKAQYQQLGRTEGITAFKEEVTQTRGYNVDNGTLAMSQSIFNTLLETGGYIEEFGTEQAAAAQLTKELSNAFGVAVQTFDDTTETLDSYLQAKYGKEVSTIDAAYELLNVDATKKIGDFTTAVQQLQADGYSYQKATELIYKQASDLDLQKLLVDGKEVNLEDILNVTEFNDAIDNLEEASHWEDVGTIIANTIADILHEEGIGNKPEKSEPVAKAPAVSYQMPENGKTTQELELKVNKNQFSQELTKAQAEVERLEKQIEENKKFGLDTKELEQQLSTARGKVVELNSELATTQNKLDKLANKTINIHYSTSGSAVPSNLPTSRSYEIAYKGKNNHISTAGFYAGSAARGRYGTVGPKDRGGLTLTGEKGFEIAWIPSENRSMILGARGPQMTDLPSDAVVYTHEQSKKILSQKSIPAGSHSTLDRYSGNAINVNIVGNQTSGSGSGSGSSSSSSSEKEKDPKRTNWYKEEITRYNLNQSINQITAQIEKTTKSIEKSLDKLGTKYSDIAKDVDTQAKLINQNISNQKALQKSYQDQINLLTNGGRSLWIDITDSAGDSSQKSISPSQFISKQSDGSYYVNRDKVMSYAAGLGGDYELQKVNADSIFNTIQSELSNLTSGLLNATKAIQDGEDELQQLIQQVADAFYAWENELTKIYDLNQQLELSDSRRGRLAAENSMLLAQIEAGFSSAVKAADRLIQIQKDDTTLIKDRIQLLKDDIKAKQDQLKLLAESSDEESDWAKYNYNNQQKVNNGGTISIEEQALEKVARDNLLAARAIEAYVKITRNQDGTYSFDLNEDLIESERLSGRLNEQTYNAVKEGFDKLVETNEDLQQSIIDASDLMTELYEEYNGHIKTLADLENDLIKAFEETARMEVSKLEALNSSLTAAAKAVLDQVKKNLDARRKAEDNAKTESDIARKQQRLNALRANTGGGNAVEIAQLEKEIGDAQKSYGRTLEDQMLSQMQTQADEASKQRQEQIDLAKQQIEYNKQAGVYAEMADYLLDNINKESDAIAATLNSTADLGTGKWQQLVDDLEIQNQVAEALTASTGIAELKEILGDNILNAEGQTTNAITTIGGELIQAISSANGVMLNTEKQVSSGTGGAKTITAPEVTKNAAPKTSSSSSPSKSSSTPKETYPYGYASKTTGLLDYGTNQYGYNQVKAVQYALRKMGYKGRDGKELTIDGEYGVNTKYAVTNFQKAMGITADGIVGNDTRKKFQAKGYKHGGLANYTGPAWLDGTPTKPELVLNAQDTKNFIALKDILSGVMRSISHTDTSNIYNSPTNFEINVNVDKISSDYDVDKLTERIKRNIVKDATYRNVTAVRNFR